MNKEEIQKLKALLVANYLYYGSQIPDQVLGMYVDDLKDLNLNQIEIAFKKIRQNHEVKRAPLPAQIRYAVYDCDDSDLAQEISSKIISSVSKFGWCNGDKAKKYLDEYSWGIIQNFGGWEELCSSINNSNMPIVRAQIRDYIYASNRKHRKHLMKPKEDIITIRYGGNDTTTENLDSPDFIYPVKPEPTEEEKAESEKRMKEFYSKLNILKNQI